MRYLIGLVIFILLIIFLIIKLLSGGSHKPALPPSLSSYADTATTVRYTIDNPVQAAETHNDIVIEVGSSSADIKITKGYDGEVVKEQSFPMSNAAYANFLLSLQHSGGYTLGNTDPALADERGYCATGDRYSYDIVSGDGRRLQHLWSTSCKEKTFKGRPDVVRQLFTAQIPGFDDYTADVDF
jgi:hypothetical protein